MKGFLSRLVLEPRSREVQRDLSDGQRLHRRVMSGFPDVGESARKTLGVLFRVESGPQGVTLLVQSQTAPEWSKLPDGYLATDWFGGQSAVAVTGLEGVLGRCVAKAEMRFRLRANPTRCIDSKSGPDGEKRRGKRVPLRREDSRLDWLRRKAEAAGFEVVEVQGAAGVMDAMQREPTVVRGRRDSGLVTIEGVLFEGRLRVMEPEVFRAALLDGIGRGRAYGFGLLSVAPL